MDVLFLLSQDERVYQDGRMINARHALPIEVVVEVHTAVKRSHNVEEFKHSWLESSGEESTCELAIPELASGE